MPGLKAPLVVGADANYFGRAFWKLIAKGGGKFLIENFVTGRYLLQDGPPIEGNRGTVRSWSPGVKAPLVVGADANYEDRAYWKILLSENNGFLFENIKTRRYLL